MLRTGLCNCCRCSSVSMPLHSCDPRQRHYADFLAIAAEAPERMGVRIQVEQETRVCQVEEGVALRFEVVGEVTASANFDQTEE